MPNLTSTQIIGLSIFVGAALSTAVGVGVADALPGKLPNDTMPLDQVKPGMKGYGLTVFSGTEPEKFDVEVISVLNNFRPDQSLILIKTPNHPRLDIAHTVAGMSGSPIYLNGKMVGAYAYGWLFGAEPVAGVTPIENMLEDQARPIPPALLPGGTSPSAMMGGGFGNLSTALGVRPRTARSFRGDPDDYDAVDHASQLARQFVSSTSDSAASVGLARTSTPLLLGGMTDASVAELSQWLTPTGLTPLQAGGGGGAKQDPTAPKQFVDGGAIGVQLVSGDISAMGLGTVTRVDGNKLVAFGHPMLGGGVTNLPTAIGKVHWILASQNRSFKIGEPVRDLGALVNDRQSSIVIDTKMKAPTFPVGVTIKGAVGAPKTEWNSQVAHDPFLAPMLAAMAIGNALETTAAERFDMTWRAVSTIDVAGYGKLEIEDFGSGSGDPIGRGTIARSRMTRAMGALLNNPWETVEITGINVEVEIRYEQDVAFLRGVKLLETEISAGDPARIRLELTPYKGEPTYRVLEVPIPEGMEGETVEIDIEPGYDVEPVLPAAESVADLMAMLPHQSYRPQSAVATIKLKDEGGASFRGNVAMRLPPGAMDVLQSTSESVAPDTFSAIERTVLPLDVFIIGDDKVRVDVKPVLK